MIDCGPSRFAIWRALRSHSAKDIVDRMKAVLFERGAPEEKDAIDGNNVTPRDDSSAATALANALYRYQVWVRGVDPVETDAVIAKGPYVPGDPVWVKPPAGRCDTPYEKGTVTKVISDQAVEIDGMPRDGSHTKSRNCHQRKTQGQYGPEAERKRNQLEHFQRTIETTGPPVFARLRRLQPERLRIAKAHFSDLLRQGIIRPSNCSWSSPLHLVPKQEPGQWRSCGDFRRLNRNTKPDRYPLPHLADFNANLYGKTIFSKIDLERAYYQVPVSPRSTPKTAVTTPFGLFEFLKMPFGLRNAAQTFQRLLDQILRGLDNCFAYVDDILVASSSETEHFRLLEKVFARLADYGIKVNPQKCVLGAQSPVFLGHLVDRDGIRPAPDKVAAIQRFPLQ
ncbi:hypothetical protein M514_20782 [Trichuris suis]|uniref:Reverse transcriptase domain-containing protein n=1 Tax=Trichuris suis TaxID=68888 RepID=A0A085NBS0_9BILA|nr:hypothetical protein M514_20782 [Trichuris suis]